MMHGTYLDVQKLFYRRTETVGRSIISPPALI